MEQVNVESEIYEKSIFLNIPFDEAYDNMRNAMVFFLLDCGFIIRRADDDGSHVTRLEKNYERIESCKLSIHDLSLTANRMNMPIEYGIFLGAKRFGNDSFREKDALVFGKLPYELDRVASDTKAFDHPNHNNEPIKLIAELRAWVRSKVTKELSGPKYYQDRYYSFSQIVDNIATKAGHESGTRIDFLDYHSLVKAHLRAEYKSRL